MKSAFALASLLTLASVSLSAAEIQTPSQFLGFEVGADRKLADYRQVSSYLRSLDASSARMEIQSLGKTTRGEDMIMAIISSEENMGKLARIKEISRKLTDPRGLSDAQVEALVAEGKVVLLISCNIHSTEIGSSQMVMEWAHSLVSNDSEEMRKRLSNVVLLLVPSLNPDGQIMETEWYRKNVGTKFEGSRMPWLYHDYTGHDNNRDWFMLTQKESRNMSRAIYHEWFPQVFLDEHQMGSTGPRIFVPPYAEPVDPDIHPLIWREANLIGANQAMRLEQAGKQGVIYGYSYDGYWPGGTKNTAWWKNITGLLTEIASVRIATPVYIHPSELSGGRKGLVEYTAQMNFPNPWKGGWWRLRDVMDYGRIISDSIHETTSTYRETFLRNMATRARDTIAAAKPREAYRIHARGAPAPEAHRLGRLMLDHNVEVLSDGTDLWIPLAQPYGRFVREMFTPQKYPEVKAVAGKEIIRPYDVAAWSLPLMFGAKTSLSELPASGLTPYRAGRSSTQALADAPFYTMASMGAESAKVINQALQSKANLWRTNDPAMPRIILDRAAARSIEQALAETLVMLEPGPEPEGAIKLRAPRVGLYRPWAASMDEGWTRWVLEQYGFAPKNLDNKTIRNSKLNDSFDAIVLPDVDKAVMAGGKPKRDEGEMRYFADLPAEYSGGLEAEGASALKLFVESGGTLIAFASSSDYIIEHFNIPVRNLLAKVKVEEFSAPGSLLNVNVEPNAMTMGIPSTVTVFVDEPIAFETTIPGAEIQKTILATYPENSDQILASGWILGEERLARKAAAVAVTYGKGQIVLLGFRPQHRAQTLATFPFIFNSLFLSASQR